MVQKIRSVSVLAGFCLLTGLVSACATQSQKQVDQDLAQTPAVASLHDLQKQTAAKINDDPRLTDDQRAKLKDLQAKFQEQFDKLRGESLQLRALLVDQLLAKKYNAHEISDIKGRIRAVDEKRLKLTFSTADQVSTILGRDEDHVQDEIQRRRTMENLLVSPSLM